MVVCGVFLIVGTGSLWALLLLGAMNQRQQLRYERSAFAHLKRISNGRPWR